MSWVPAAHMHNTLDLWRYAVKASIQAFNAIVQCHLDIAHEQRFIQLDVAATRVGKCANFKVQRIGEIERQLPLTLVIDVRGGIDDGHRTGHSCFDWPLGAGLRHLVITVEEMLARGYYLAGNRGQVGDGCAVTVHLGSQRVEIKAVHMAAVMVNVVFTPLNAILGFAQSLELNSKEPLTPSQEMATNRILQGGKHLLSLIEDVLDLAKIESGKLELYYNDVQLAEVIKRSCIMLEGQASERHIQLLVPPDARCNYIVHADDTRLSQCLVNLLSNAIKYNHEGGTVTVKVEELEGGRLRISVIDSGVGIPLGKRDELFRPFSRLGYENSGVQGTGIGLSYSKRLIELMGGSIGFESTHDKGSEFWLEVKAMREIDEGEESPTCSSHGP